MPLFFWFDLFLETRAEILKKLLLVFLVETMEPKRHFEISWPLVEVCLKISWMYPKIVLIEDCTNHCSKKWMGHCPSIRVTTFLSVWFSPKFSLIDYMYWKIKEKFLWNHRCTIIQKSNFQKVTSKEWLQKATSKKPL